MNVIPYLLSQADLLATLKQEMRDDQSARWTTKEYYNAINSALQRWAGRVYVPYIYTLTNGFTTGTYEYSIPWYIREPIDVQVKLNLVQPYSGFPIYISSNSIFTWIDVVAWEIEPDGAGGQKVRIGTNPWPQEARVIWWGEHGRLPLSVPTLSASMTDTDTSLSIASKPNVGPTGFVKVDDEWMSYAGYTVSSSSTTLTNLERGLNGTVAAAHSLGATVSWGVAAMRQDLYQQLEQQCYANLHNLFLTNAAPQETQNHIFQVRYYQQMADEYWNRYTSERSPKLRLTRQGLGTLIG